MQSWAENLSERQLASEKSHAVKTKEKSKVGVLITWNTNQLGNKYGVGKGKI
jgi:hypothetical protein